MGFTHATRWPHRTWAKSLLGQMGYVKRKCSNAGSVSLPQLRFSNTFADIQAEVAMNEVPPDLIFNWDQTALHLVSTGWWTMHHASNKIIPITNSNDKHQVIAVPSLHTGLFYCASVHEHSVYAKRLHMTTNLTFSTHFCWYIFTCRKYVHSNSLISNLKHI